MRTDVPTAHAEGSMARECAMVDSGSTLWTRTHRSEADRRGEPPRAGWPSWADRPRFTPGTVVLASAVTLVVLAVWVTSVVLS